MSVPLRIVLIVLIAVVALAIGLILRRLLVRRLEKTVLDQWLVQVIGIIPILPPLIIAAFFAPAIWDNQILANEWETIQGFLQSHDTLGFAGGFIETVLIIVLGLGIARTIMKFAIRGMGQSHIDINIRTLMGRIFYIITVIIVIFWVLSIWQISIGLPVALLGTLTVAFTFAVQDILKNLLLVSTFCWSGLFISVTSSMLATPTIPVGALDTSKMSKFAPLSCDSRAASRSRSPIRLCSAASSSTTSIMAIDVPPLR